MDKLWKETFKQRAILVFVLLLVFLGIVMLRQLWLQCFNDSFYKYEARKKQSYLKQVVGVKRGLRGDILDRNHQALATSSDRRSINSHPYQIKDPALVSTWLAPILKMDQGKLYSILSSDETFVNLKYKAPDEMCDAVKKLYREKQPEDDPDDETKNPLYGIEVVRENSGHRFYPKGRLASHILGIVNRDEEGVEGTELLFDRELAPQTYNLDEEMDVAGNTIPGAPSAAAKKNKEFDEASLNGSSIVLTIDERIQFIVEEELRKTVAQFNAFGGSIVVLDAKNADILAMATYPDFDPATYYKFPQERWRNRAVCDVYEPGSIFKVLSAGVAINNGYRASSQFYCPGRLYIEGDVVNNADDGLYSKGYETISDIVAYSFNTGTASFALELGKKKMGEGLDKFGIGHVTGTEVLGESCGLFDNWEDWGRFRLANISFGQGVAITPLQLASAVQAIANDGVRMKPHLVKEILTPDGKVVHEYIRKEADEDRNGAYKEVIHSLKPEVLSKPMTKSGAREMREVMAGVISHGTGSRARVPGYKVGGKTGTAQVAGEHGYMEGQYIAGFVGIAPIDNPEVVVVVKIERPGPIYYGGLVAAPVFNKVCTKILPVLGVPPTPGYKQLNPETGL